MTQRPEPERHEFVRVTTSSLCDLCWEEEANPVHAARTEPPQPAVLSNKEEMRLYGLIEERLMQANVVVLGLADDITDIAVKFFAEQRGGHHVGR